MSLKNRLPQSAMFFCPHRRLSTPGASALRSGVKRLPHTATLLRPQGRFCASNLVDDRSASSPSSAALRRTRCEPGSTAGNDDTRVVSSVHVTMVTTRDPANQAIVLHAPATQTNDDDADPRLGDCLQLVSKIIKEKCTKQERMTSANSGPAVCRSNRQNAINRRRRSQHLQS